MKKNEVLFLGLFSFFLIKSQEQNEVVFREVPVERGESPLVQGPKNPYQLEFDEALGVIENHLASYPILSRGSREIQIVRSRDRVAIEWIGEEMIPMGQVAMSDHAFLYLKEVAKIIPRILSELKKEGVEVELQLTGLTVSGSLQDRSQDELSTGDYHLGYQRVEWFYQTLDKLGAFRDRPKVQLSSLGSAAVEPKVRIDFVLVPTFRN